MRKKYIYWLFVLFAILILDSVVGVVGEYMMKNVNSDKGVAKDDYRLNKSVDDVIIIGSSRAAYHYVPSIICDSIVNHTGNQYSVYNAGVSGCYINSSLCVIESILDRYRPKLIILDTYNPEFWSNNARANLEASIVSYSVNPYVKKSLDDLGWRERCKCLSSMYRYNQKLIQIISLFLKNPSVSDGYIPLQGSKLITTNTVSEVQIVDNYTIQHFRSTLKRVKNLMIPIIVVGSPCYNPRDNNEIVSGLCEECGVLYADLYSIEEFNEHEDWFYDEKHLNDLGARVFSSRLFGVIKPLL